MPALLRLDLVVEADAIPNSAQFEARHDLEVSGLIPLGLHTALAAP